MQLKKLKGNGLNINLTDYTEAALLQAPLGLTANLGGYNDLRAILERAAYTFTKARHVEPCKGILLVGLPGCGKDLCKRVVQN